MLAFSDINLRMAGALAAVGCVLGGLVVVTADPVPAPACLDPSLADDIVWIPGGQFELGARNAFPEEAPPVDMTLDGFWMDIHEVTNGQFEKFVNATGYVTTAERAETLAPWNEPRRPAGSFRFMRLSDGRRQPAMEYSWHFDPHATWRTPGGADSSIKGKQHYPVVHVTYDDAIAYARWLGRDLPSEAQWEYAARENSSAVAEGAGGNYPGNVWHGAFPFYNSAIDGFAGVAPVGCFAPNSNGLFDMVGNVWELTRSAYTPFHGAPPQNATNVIKGGSFLCSADFCARFRSTARQPRDLEVSSDHVGFRTVLNVQGAPNL